MFQLRRNVSEAVMRLTRVSGLILRLKYFMQLDKNYKKKKLH